MDKNSTKSALFLIIAILLGLAISILIPGTNRQANQPETALLPVTQEPQTNQIQLKYMSNPAALYCRELGYEYRVVKGEDGDQGECVLPNSVCDGWDFMNGKCGQEYNYCSELGMRTLVRHDGNNAYSPEYAVCVSSDGRTSTSASTLFGIEDRIERSACAQIAKSDGLPRAYPGPGLTVYLPAIISFKNPSVATSTPIINPTSTSWTKPTIIPTNIPTNTPTKTTTPPEDGTFDWRNYNGGNWLTAVRDQGNCGGCWAFSAIGVAEAALNIASGNPALDQDLSEQYLISDCDATSGSCCGGYESDGLNFIKEEGVPDEGCFPYTDGDSCECDYSCTCAYDNGDMICSDKTCSDRCSDYSSRLSTIDEVEYGFSTNREVIKQKLKEYGPLAAAIGYETDNRFDADGIYHCQSYSGPNDINHAIVIVGYNDTDEYWIIRNSWGSTWNGDGYFKLGYGECGIEEEVTYAIKN